MFCGLRLRRQTVLIVCLFAALLAAGVALATVGKFSRVTSSATLSTPTTAAAALSGTTTADPTTLTATLTVNFTESGLGNVGSSDTVNGRALTVTTTYFCVNGGSNQPKAGNKITIAGPEASGTGTFLVDHNGKITGQLTLTAQPADPGTFACPRGQTEFVFMTFAQITLQDVTTGGNGVAPDATTNTVQLG